MKPHVMVLELRARRAVLFTVEGALLKALTIDQARRIGITSDPAGDVHWDWHIHVRVKLVPSATGPIRVRWSPKAVIWVGEWMCREGFERGTGLRGPVRGTRRYALQFAGAGRTPKVVA